jgi:rhodanese-related sulfurtransferase
MRYVHCRILKVSYNARVPQIVTDELDIPLKDIKGSSSRIAGLSGNTSKKSTISNTPPQVIFLCKQGNDSQVAASIFRRAMAEEKDKGKDIAGSSDDVIVRDVRGGLRAWSKHVDPSFPLY